jgi:hypothetical protein
MAINLRELIPWRKAEPYAYEKNLIQGVRALEQRRSAGKGGKHILIACMPKSASTFLYHSIARLPGFTRGELTILAGRREQELSVCKCAHLHHLNYVAQNHVRYSEATQIIMTTFDIFPVILTRNIFDCVVSLRDHFCNESLEAAIAYIPREFLNLSVEKQYDAVINLAVPWYANFFACWAEYEGPALRVSFDEIAKDPVAVISQIVETIGLEYSLATIERACENVSGSISRFNVGKSGRGRALLSPAQVARVREIFSIYSHLDGIDRILE